MMQTPLENILIKLQDELGIKLQMDTTGGFSLLIDKRLKVQIGTDKHDHTIYLIAFIAPLTAGKFREKVLLEALKINTRYPREFTLAYIERLGYLVATKSYPIESLDGKKTKQLLFSLADFSFLWIKAFDANQTMPFELVQEEKYRQSGMFGLQ